ncbi:MAG: ATP-grasp domain-containing protein [Candidatus Omnitrophica bacterium]|nr:ATP-grasp domain-containing protein [Candidatus Omnitrophota bacterium]
MNKTIMFIGAGKYQAAGIRKAREMGLRIVAIDADPKAEGSLLADAFHAVDIKDVTSAIKIARENRIDGVLTVASDIGVKTVAAVSDALGLPGISQEVADRSTDKALMRRAFAAHGVPSPQSFAVDQVAALVECAEKIGFPVVVKPADSAGSRGVKLVNDEAGLKEAFEIARGYSAKAKVVVEAFMHGVEVSVEAFVSRGEISIVALSDKVRTAPPYLLDIDVIFPSAYPADVQGRIIEVARKAIRAIGITMGPVHMELMMTPEGPVPVELAARGPGFKVFTDMLPAVTGIDMLKALIQVSLGQEPVLERTASRASALRFLSATDGIVTAVGGLDQARSRRGIYDADIYVRPGERVRALTCGSDRIGHIIALADTRVQALAALAAAEKDLWVTIEKGTAT